MNSAENARSNKIRFLAVVSTAVVKIGNDHLLSPEYNVLLLRTIIESQTI